MWNTFFLNARSMCRELAQPHASGSLHQIAVAFTPPRCKLLTSFSRTTTVNACEALRSNHSIESPSSRRWRPPSPDGGDILEILLSCSSAEYVPVRLYTSHIFIPYSNVRSVWVCHSPHLTDLFLFSSSLCCRCCWLECKPFVKAARNGCPRRMTLSTVAHCLDAVARATTVPFNWPFFLLS